MNRDYPVSCRDWCQMTKCNNTTTRLPKGPKKILPSKLFLSYTDRYEETK